MSENVLSVSIGEIVTSDQPNEVLVAYGLGSCVAVCLYDPVARVGGMAHALLPETPSSGEKAGSGPAKFVDQGVPALLAAVLKLGAQRSRLKIGLCGGGKVLTIPGANAQFPIGQRNVEAAEKALRQKGMAIHLQDTGGDTGRTVRLQVSDGQVTVKTFGKGIQVLDLASARRQVKRHART